MNRANIACFMFLLLGAVCGLHAHDPGLSFVEVHTNQGGVLLEAVFAEADVAFAAPVDPDRAGRTAPPGLQQIAWESFEAYSDVGRWPVATAEVGVKESEEHVEVHFKVVFARPAGFAREDESGLRVRSKILERLPRGHRQLLTFFDSKGQSQAEILSSVDPDFEAQPVQKKTEGDKAGTPVGWLVLGIAVAAGYWLLQTVTVGAFARVRRKAVLSWPEIPRSFRR